MFFIVYFLNCVLEVFLKKIENFLFFYLLQINIFFIFSDYFDVLMLKIIFFKKNIILMYFKMKNSLESKRDYNSKQTGVMTDLRPNFAFQIPENKNQNLKPHTLKIHLHKICQRLIM
jgi:hypothetical protein